jgi:hypothetical protein
VVKEAEKPIIAKKLLQENTHNCIIARIARKYP